jgi:hypothetical protein
MKSVTPGIRGFDASDGHLLLMVNKIPYYLLNVHHPFKVPHSTKMPELIGSAIKEPLKFLSFEVCSAIHFSIRARNAKNKKRVDDIGQA